MPASARVHCLPESFAFARRCIFSLQFIAQSFEQAWEGGDYRDAMSANGIDDFRWTQRLPKIDLATEQVRNIDADHLTEDMTQWKKGKEPDWVKQPFQSIVLDDLPLHDPETG